VVGIEEKKRKNKIGEIRHRNPQKRGTEKEPKEGTRKGGSKQSPGTDAVMPEKRGTSRTEGDVSSSTVSGGGVCGEKKKDRSEQRPKGSR